MSEKKAMRLELLSLTKAYPGCIANDKVSLQVAPGEIHALLGENGAGKSTLMKMIYGVVKPDAGQMTWNDREVHISGPAHARQLGMGMVFQHFSLFETLTVTENIALYLTPAEYGTLDLLRARIIAVGDEYGLAINPDRLVHSLSVGEQQRVEIIRCLLQDIQLLILDEPTAVLTPPEVAQLIGVLKKLAHKGCSILFISHKLHEVNALCDKATILRGGKVTGTCIPSETSPSQMARLMLGDELELQESMPAGKAGECLLSLDKINVKPRDAFAIHLQDIHLQLHAGEILGLAGVAGNGQDELVDLINGELNSDSGNLIFHGKDIGHTGVQERRQMGLGVIPADRIGRGALGNMSLTENNLLTSYINQSGKFGWLNWPAIKARATAIIANYNVKATGADASAKSLSGGNLQKFIIGREILQNPNVLVCFHPTWGVDVGAANLIHQELIKLRDKGAAILVISEDLDELYLLADRLGALCGGRLSPLAPKKAVPLAQLGQWMTGNFGSNAAVGLPMHIEKRLQDSQLMVYLSPLLALLLTLISGALLFALLGRPPLGSLYTFFIAPISDLYGLSELAVKVTPLLLCAIGLTLCFKAKIWNIGAEGQFVFGALIGGAVTLQLAESKGVWVLPAIIASGALAGMAWAGIAALLLTRFNANEILTTIMLNYIAVNLLLWAVHGPLKDPDGQNFPESALFASQTLLPMLFDDFRVSIAIFIALFMLVVIWVVLTRTLLGFQLRVMGENHNAARFAGFKSKTLIWLLLCFSGAMAGVAAISETNGPVGQLIPTLSLGYGYAAIIVVFMGRMHPLGILLASCLLGLTYLGGEMAQIDQGLPKSITGLFQGMLLFYLLACDLLISYRVVPKSHAHKSAAITQ